MIRSQVPESGPQADHCSSLPSRQSCRSIEKPTSKWRSRCSRIRLAISGDDNRHRGRTLGALPGLVVAADFKRRDIFRTGHKNTALCIQPSLVHGYSKPLARRIPGPLMGTSGMPGSAVCRVSRTHRLPHPRASPFATCRREKRFVIWSNRLMECPHSAQGVRPVRLRPHWPRCGPCSECCARRSPSKR